ncbi:MAG: TolC family protein [Chthonomonadetes bacterium]|nr:TolC family protein [Chthonomonadetes bacterium]
MSLLIMLAISVPSIAQQMPEPLTLEEAVRIGIERNLDYKGAIQDIRAASAKKEQARALAQPKLEWRISLQHLPEPPVLKVPPISLKLPNPANPQSPLSVTVPVPEIELARATAKRATLVFSLPVYTSGRIENAIKAASLGVQASDSLSRAKANEVALQVTRAYLQAVLAQEVVKVQQQVLEVVEAHLKQAEMLYQQGIVAQYDVLRARAELASQQKRLTDAQNQYALAMSLLLSLLNLPQEQKITLSTPLRELVYSGTYEDTLKSATETSHEIKALQAKTRALQALALSAEAEAKPQVLFSVNLETLTEDLSAIEPHASLTIGVRWNLFDAGYAKAVAREHRETAERTRIDQQRLENALALRIKQAMFEMESAQQGLKAAQRSVEASQESLRLAQRRFETGVGTSVEILDAILAVSQAKIQQQLALYQMDNAYYTLLHLTNQLLKELGTNP